MELKTAIELANQGDSKIMVQLAFYYWDQKEYSDAADWAEKAAEAGEREGVIFVRAVRSVLGEASCGIGVFEDALEEWKTVKKWTEYSLHNLQLDNEERANAECDLRTSEYRISLCYYRLGQYEEAIKSNSRTDTEGTMLRGLCIDKIALQTKNSEMLRTAYQVLSCIEGDRDFFNRKKDGIDESTFTLAVISLAGFYTFGLQGFLKPDLNKAVSLLDRATGVLQTPKCRSFIQEQRSKYQKRLFGGYRYIQ